MATITGYTAARMQEIEDGTVVSGNVTDGDLILTKHDGSQFNAGTVRGPQGLQGATGDVAEAPEDGGFYIRKDGVWVALDDGLAPHDGTKYVLKDGVWVPMDIASPPPNDGNKYSLRNGVWVRADRPWTTTFANTGTAPAGFSVGAIASDTTWSFTFTGSGYNVNYNCTFRVSGTGLSNDTRFTLPTSLRPVVNHYGLSHMKDTRSNYLNTGIAAMLINTGGAIIGPQLQGGVMVGTIQGGSNQTKIQVTSGVVTEFTMTGSFTRASDALPSTAAYV